MLIEANMTEQERQIDNKIKELKDIILFLDKKYTSIKRKKHITKEDLETINQIEKEVSFYIIERNKLYEKLKRGV